jgi:hypothetical protein
MKGKGQRKVRDTDVRRLMQQVADGRVKFTGMYLTIRRNEQVRVEDNGAVLR